MHTRAHTTLLFSFGFGSFSAWGREREKQTGRWVERLGDFPLKTLNGVLFVYRYACSSEKSYSWWIFEGGVFGDACGWDVCGWDGDVSVVGHVNVIRYMYLYDGHGHGHVYGCAEPSRTPLG